MTGTLRPELGLSPEKAKEYCDAFGGDPDKLVELVNAVTEETIACCVEAIRMRANYLKRTGYTDDTYMLVRHVASWLASEAGQECIAEADRKRTPHPKEKK